MKHFFFISLYLFGLCMVALGCSPSPTTLHPSFGQSVTAFKNAQILHPENTGKEDPVEDFMGTAADTTVKQYEKSFTRRQQRNARNFTVLGATTTQGGGTGGGAGS